MKLAKARKTFGHHISEVLSDTIEHRLFARTLELVPQLNEVYELELAFYESQVLSDEEIIRNGAYFARVGDTFTRHFLICSGEPVRLPKHSSSRLRSFFRTNQFKTGYATHGLFPYRGKFHPQMIKALINIMGLKPGETVLDPMMGSGTVLIEARLMGIKSIGLDASPFCRFMTQAKIDGLTVPLDPVRAALRDARQVFDYFQASAGRQNTERTRIEAGETRDLFEFNNQIDESAQSAQTEEAKLPPGCEAEQVYNFLLLAYLDSAGYSERSARKAPFEQFRAILERYLVAAEKIQNVLSGAEDELAEARPLQGDARNVPIPERSVDGIIFSPPYSFAIDYLSNDAFHLGYMGTDLEKLRQEMLGLRGKSPGEKFELYKEDMEKVLSECARILRTGRICTIIVGTNNNQLSKILGIPPGKVKGIDEILVELGGQHGLKLIRKLERQITGMANTMRTEYIVILQRT